ncbi:MAG TPA: isoprenylcysteine carboxylmethyltransferase family protein [Candidatus Polarisedimenticolaceae bacterium]|nr:isoprenylcysteine carboxylmethyltransferase family protein [Candidatus Polarisedimenticolaceae bacterium]
MSEGNYNRALGAVRLLATFAFIVTIVVFARPRPFEVALGFVIAAIGEGIRFWAAGHLLKTKELITSGPYRYTRNPLYLGRMLIMTGLCIMCRLPYFANLILLAIGYAIFLGYYMPRKERVEPARLRAIHGDAYDRYFKAVPALIPTLRPYQNASNLGWSSDRMFRNREVWMVVGILAVSVFLLYRSHRLPPPEEAAPVAAPAPSVSGS